MQKWQNVAILVEEIQVFTKQSPGLSRSLTASLASSLFAQSLYHLYLEQTYKATLCAVLEEKKKKKKSMPP